MTEHQIQKALFLWINFMATRDGRYKKIWAIPNGGKRNIWTAARMKQEGVRKGVPDIFGAIPSRKYHGFFIEMKAPGRKPTQEQSEMLKLLSEAGYAVQVFTTAPEAQDWIERYMLTVN